MALNAFLRFRLSMALLNLAIGAIFFFVLALRYVFRYLTDEEVASLTLEEQLDKELEALKDGGPVSSGIDMPLMLWWTAFSVTKGLKECSATDGSGTKKCFFVTDRKYLRHPMMKGIFFYGTRLEPWDLPLPRLGGHEWALLHEESPKNSMLFDHASALELFNYTATFKRHSHLPLTLQYLQSLDHITEETFLLPLKEKERLAVAEGLAPVAYVQSNCDNPMERDDFVKELMKYIRVDSYGECLKNKQWPSGQEDLSSPEMHSDYRFLRMLSKYKFILAVENAACDDYVTEKLWTSLRVGAVPVYLGAPNVASMLPNGDNSAVLVSRFATAKALAEHILFLDGNDEEYAKYLAHKRLYNNSTQLISNALLLEMMSKRDWGVSVKQQLEIGNFIESFECLVCERVATNNFMAKAGFKVRSSVAKPSHYGCPRPSPALQSLGHASPVKSTVWQEEWDRSRRQAERMASSVQSGERLDQGQMVGLREEL